MDKLPDQLPIDPPQVVDAFLEPMNLTLGKLAILEKIKSPLLGSREDAEALDLIPSLYVLAHPAKLIVSSMDKIKENSIEWAEGLSLEDYKVAVIQADQALARFFDAIPKNKSDSIKNP